MKEILSKTPNKRIILLGNKAICRGALESGVQFVSTYPGTPASEVGNTFYKIQNSRFRIKSLHFEFSTNEKVAMEAGAGAALCGLRSLVAVKHFGLNVATDFLLPLVYTGVRGGMVILVADDPSGWSSAQTEENTRSFGYFAHIPILEPSEPQESKDFTKFAFDLSERFKIPIIIRHTTRASHQAAPVKLGKIKIGRRKAKFVKNPHQFSTMPPRVLEEKKELLEKIEKIREISEKSPINVVKIQNSKTELPKEAKVKKRTKSSSPFKIQKAGIITSGVSYLYVMEALKKLNLEIPVLKLGFFNPLPNKKIKKFIKNLRKVLIVEELEPFLEREVKMLAKEVNPSLEVWGKEGGPFEGGRIWQGRKNILPEIGELKPEYVILAITRFAKRKPNFNFKEHLEKFNKIKLPGRHPVLCPGCPYWNVFPRIKKLVPKDTVYGGEIGCYMLALYPPFEMQDYLYCMGSSTGVAHGIKKSLEKFGSREGKKQKMIAFTGDSSFFHASIPALINTIFNGSNPLIIVMDNLTTAMTGHQPHPGIGRKVDHSKPIKIEKIVRACGVKNVKVVDQVKNPKEFEDTVKEFLEKDEVSVIIAKSPCIFVK